MTHDADVTAVVEQQKTVLELLRQLISKVDAMSEELAALKAEHEPVPVPLPVPKEEPSTWQRVKHFFRRTSKT